MSLPELWQGYTAWFEQLHWWQILAMFVALGIFIFLLLKGISFMFDKIDEMSKKE